MVSFGVQKILSKSIHEYISPPKSSIGYEAHTWILYPFERRQPSNHAHQHNIDQTCAATPTELIGLQKDKNGELHDLKEDAHV